ncbi:MAG: hypothetical protein AAFR14_07080 [Bacteroidota bacterium]
MERLIFLAGSVVLLIVFIFCSWSSDKSVPDLDLIGKWDLYAASRNGKSTLTLKDAYFEFVNDTLLVSNILREDREFTYTIEGDLISVVGDVNTIYNFEQVGQDSIVLRGELLRNDFEFFVRRDSIGRAGIQ